MKGLECDLKESRKQTCLVDLENIGTQALYQYINAHTDTKYIIFHSDSTSTPSAILAHIPEDISVTFIDCRSGGNNAMDFCICAMAGVLAKDNTTSIRILSNDKGYDPILYMFHHQGIRMVRETTPDLPTVANISLHEKKNPRWKENVPLIRAIRSAVPKTYQEEVIAALSGASNRQHAHEMLQSILPSKIVPDTYRRLKKHIPKDRI